VEAVDCPSVLVLTSSAIVLLMIPLLHIIAALAMFRHIRFWSIHHRCKLCVISRFAAAGRTQHQQVVTGGDPVALTELKNGTAIQISGWREINILEGGLHRKASRFDVAVYPALAAPDTFVISEQGETIFNLLSDTEEEYQMKAHLIRV
jgi:hypothetical protein